MKKHTKIIAFLLAMTAMLSVFSISASAANIPFDLRLAYTGVATSQSNNKDAAGNRSYVAFQRHSFEIPPQYIWFYVSTDSKGVNPISNKTIPDNDAFYVYYNKTVAAGTPCYLNMETAHRAANCLGTWMA